MIVSVNVVVEVSGGSHRSTARIIRGQRTRPSLADGNVGDGTGEVAASFSRSSNVSLFSLEMS